jgi:hypothetical protein
MNEEPYMEHEERVGYRCCGMVITIAATSTTMRKTCWHTRCSNLLEGRRYNL